MQACRLGLSPQGTSLCPPQLPPPTHGHPCYIGGGRRRVKRGHTTCRSTDLEQTHPFRQGRVTAPKGQVRLSRGSFSPCSPASVQQSSRQVLLRSCSSGGSGIVSSIRAIFMPAASTTNAEIRSCRPFLLPSRLVMLSSIVFRILMREMERLP